MLRITGALLLFIALTGCAKMGRLEEHPVRVTGVIGVNCKDGSVTYLYEYLDLNTGIYCSDRSERPLKVGDLFTKKVLVPAG